MAKMHTGTARQPESENRSSRPIRNTLAVVGAGALALHGGRLVSKLLGPPLPYGMLQPPNDALDSEEFVRFLGITTNSACHRDNRIQVLRNGEEFYRAELDVIRGARNTLNLLFYEFLMGDVAAQFLDALIERARAGVKVKLIVDAIGSFATRDSYFNGLRAAGGRVEWYHALGWRTWTQMDNRTHRKVMISDGEIGFVGGAGVADCWMKAGAEGPAWRDTMLRVEGSAVGGLVSVFSENWADCSGDILSGGEQFPLPGAPGSAKCLVITSTPHGGSTRARTLFQTVIDCARHGIRITNPYFLPDRSARRAIIRAMHRRNVSVQILTAGPLSDHRSISKLSESMTLDLLKAGAEIYEYQPAMIHAKLMTIDGQWSVAGSTNFDHRSFALNDEVNIATLDRDLAMRLDRDFEEDLSRSVRRTVKSSMERSASVRLMDRARRIFSREA